MLDENVPVELARALRAAGHDVLVIPPELRAADDPSVLAFARDAGRALVTLDTDFGSLVFVARQAPPPAVVLIRLRATQVVPRVAAIVRAIEATAAARGSFVVIDGDEVRVRPLPG
jgi:predicted nuclease of predicted toxin-antitoxin system